MERYRNAQPHTMVDIARPYELWSLDAETAKIDRDILEVGVWRGGTGLLLAAHAQVVSRGRDVFLCDTFKGVVKAGQRDTAYAGGEHADANIDGVNKLLTENDVHNCIILPGIFPDETGPIIASRRFSLCHIDVDVYDSGLGVFDWVWPRMAPGGVVVLDDYGFGMCPGITQLCEESRARPDLVFIHNLNGHAVLMKTKA
jgi:O-methyltransferase